MAITCTTTLNTAKPEWIGRHRYQLSGYFTTGGTYETDGFDPDIAKYFRTLYSVQIEVGGAYNFLYDYTNDKIKVYHPTGAGTVSAGSSHTHAVALDSGASAAGSSHTHTLTAKYEPDFAIAVKPVIALTHNADPATNLSAAALYAYEAQGRCSVNTINLESTTNGNADIWGETANGTVGLIAASLRFLVTDNDTPNGVQIYVNEASSDQLEFISPTEIDGYIVMLFEAAAGAPGGFACAVTVHHNASADSGKALYFDDNGAADAQLAFVDTGAAGGVIPAADITVLAPAYMADAAANLGTAAAEAAHTHAAGTLADAASGAEAAHTHTITGETGDEFTNGGTLALSTGVRFVATGRK